MAPFACCDFLKINLGFKGDVSYFILIKLSYNTTSEKYKRTKLHGFLSAIIHVYISRKQIQIKLCRDKHTE